MFGYPCQECGKGTIRKTVKRNHEVKFGRVPFVVPEAIIGVCDVCGEENISGREYMRWRALFDQARARGDGDKDGGDR